MNTRPPDRWSSVAKCCAMARGVREKMLMIEVPSWIECVSPASTASSVRASGPQASAMLRA